MWDRLWYTVDEVIIVGKILMDPVTFAVILIALTVVGLVALGVYMAKRYRNIENQPDRPLAPQYVERTFHATVVDMACWVRMGGSYKSPEAMQEFAVVFQDEYGKQMKFMIPEEMYHGLEKGQFGIVTVRDGELYGFELE
jgi:hypothetical protein